MGFAELARALGIGGVNPGGTLARIENGSRQPDADMVERIERFTCGIVTAADMHAVRLSWLKVNRPEKFAVPPFVASRDTSPPEGVADGRQEGDRLPTAECRLPAVDGRAVAEAAE